MTRMLIGRLAMVLTIVLFAGPASAQNVNPGDLLRISNALNGITTMEGTFVQVGPNGDLSEGLFYMRRPGRIRFEYQPPNPALIISDGFWVGVCDKISETIERFPLSETPLDLLLRDRVDLRNEGAITAIDRSEGQMRVTAVDPDAPDQGSITMVFDDATLELRQWIVLDTQGLATTVALSDTRRNVALDPNLFFIEDRCAI